MSWEQIDLLRGSSWSQPPMGSPNPFTDATHPIASFASTAVFAPGLEGDIFVFGRENATSYDTHIWRYKPSTNAWSYVTTWTEAFIVHSVAAAYGFGQVYTLGSDTEDRPFILFATCEDTVDGALPNSGGNAGAWLYFFYDNTGTATISQPEILQATLNPHVAWDGATAIWMFGKDGDGNPQLCVKYTSDTSTWTDMSATFDPGVADTDYPRVRSGALFAYMQSIASSPGSLILSHGEDEGDELDSSWAFNGSAWARFYSTPSPSARYRVGYGSRGSDASGVTILLLGGIADGSELNDLWTVTGDGWAQLDDYPTAWGYPGWAACGKMIDGTGIIVL